MNQAPLIQSSKRIQLTPKQANIYVWGWQESARFRYAVCGRRFGKTFLLQEEMRRAARLAFEWDVPPENEIWYGAPSFKQAKRVFWRTLKRAIPRFWLDGRWNESECFGTLKSGHIIRIVGLDNFEDLRGSGLFFFAGDEWDDAKPEAWTEVILPMLGTARGHALFIGSPKGFGSLYDGFVAGQPGGDPDVRSWKYSTLDGGNVPQSEIDRARKTLDARTFRQEYEASFETFAGRVLYAFDRRHNVRPAQYDPALPVHIGMDFNVNPMTAIICQEHGDEDWQIDEIVIETSSTDEMADEIAQRYGRRVTGNPRLMVDHIHVYPDPAGAQSRTSAQGKTDISILRSRGFVVHAMASHPLVRDRIAATNARYEAADGVRRAFVDPKCTKSIKAYEKHAYKEGTSVPDKDDGFDHLVDARGYYVYARWHYRGASGGSVQHMGR